MTDAGAAGEELDQDGGQAGLPQDGQDDGWPPEPEPEPEPGPRSRLGWLFAAFAVVVIGIGAAVVALATGDTTIPHLDPAHLSAPVTLPPAPPARTPEPPPTPTGTQALAGGDVCPGSDGVSADDQPGWQHETVGTAAGPAPACAGRYSLHTTSTTGGVFYRWMVEVTQSGHCDITVYIPDTPRADVATVRYSVLDGETLVEGFIVAQANDRGQFVSAGSYPTSGTAPLTVRMDNRSPVPGTVVASAVRFACHPG